MQNMSGKRRLKANDHWPRALLIYPLFGPSEISSDSNHVSLYIIDGFWPVSVRSVPAVLRSQASRRNGD